MINEKDHLAIMDPLQLIYLSHVGQKLLKKILLFGICIYLECEVLE